MICEAFGINLGYWMIFFGIGTLIGLIIINILLTKLNNALHESKDDNNVDGEVKYGTQ